MQRIPTLPRFWLCGAATLLVSSSALAYMPPGAETPPTSQAPFQEQYTPTQPVTGNNDRAPSFGEQMQGDVVFLTGGVGEDERLALQDARANYNVHIMISSKDGAFISGTSIVITDRKGNEVLATEAGPLLYATLPNGKYTLAAEFLGIEQTKTLYVQHNKSNDVHLIWDVANE